MFSTVQKNEKSSEAKYPRLCLYNTALEGSLVVVMLTTKLTEDSFQAVVVHSNTAAWPVGLIGSFIGEYLSEFNGSVTLST
jgi:hypothetical protein